MALISCPECGAQISDEAKLCVHCGCTFTVCPECKTVTVGKPPHCPSCGFAFPVQPVAAAQPAVPVQPVPPYALPYAPAPPVMQPQSATAFDNYVAMWENSSPLRKNYAKISRVIGIVLDILVAVMGALMVVSIIGWKNDQDALASLLKAEGVLSSVKAYNAVVCCCIAISMVKNTFAGTYAEISMSNWLRANHIDPLPAMAQYYGMETDMEMVNFATLHTAAYMNAVSSARGREYAMIFGLLAFAAGFAVALGVCAVENMQYYILNTVMLELPFSFQFVSLLVAIAFLAAYVVLYFAGYRAIGKKKNAWLDQVMPGMREKLENKIDEVIDKM